MNWRAKLQEQRGAIFQKGPGDSLTKLTKPSSVGFVSDPSGHSANIAVAPLDAPALKTEVSEHPLATVATVATVEAPNRPSVAEVATVAGGSAENHFSPAPDADHQRDRLRTAARAEGLPCDEIDRLTPQDVEGVEHWTDAQLRRVVHWYHRDPPRLWRKGAA